MGVEPRCCEECSHSTSWRMPRLAASWEHCDCCYVAVMCNTTCSTDIGKAALTGMECSETRLCELGVAERDVGRAALECRDDIAKR